MSRATSRRAARPRPSSLQIAGSTGGHTTRDIAVSADGKTLLVSVGSGSNVADGMPKKTPAETAAWAADHALGAAWGKEDGRADVLAFYPDGSGRSVFASGIRNCVSVVVNPSTGQPWCAVNERDSLGDNLPPDYVTRVKAKAFYGWPWYYIGDHEDPRLKGQRPRSGGKDHHAGRADPAALRAARPRPSIPRTAASRPFRRAIAATAS